MEIHFVPFIILLSFILLFSTLLKLRKTSKNNATTSNLPPGPIKLPFIGNLLHLAVTPRLPHHILRDLAVDYGPIMHLQLGEISTIVVSSPEVAEEVLKTHGIVFSSRPSLAAAEILFYGRTDIAFAPYGDHWRHVRKICTSELLNTKRVQSIGHIRESEFLNLCKWIASNEGSTINLTQGFITTNYDIVTRSSFGEKTVEQEVFVSVLKEAMDLMGGFYIGDLYPSIKVLQYISGFKGRIEKLHRQADRILDNIIRQRMETVSEVNLDNPKLEENLDLLDVLLRLHDSDLELPLTMDNVKSVMLDLFFGGSENSSMTLDWAMSEMLKNPRILKKAQDEVRQFFDKKGGSISESHLDELKYMKSIIKETLRLHPVAPLLPRESIETCDILGYNIPSKTRAIINIWAINRHPNHWENAEHFIPERFVNNSVDYKGNDFQYIPFGAGRRICPGMAYGIANVELPLALLLYHFDWRLPQGMKSEEMDMTEAFGFSVRRKNVLHLVPVVARPLFTKENY